MLIVQKESCEYQLFKSFGPTRRGNVGGRDSASRRIPWDEGVEEICGDTIHVFTKKEIQNMLEKAKVTKNTNF